MEQEMKHLLRSKIVAENMPKISIVSPSFNCAKYLRRCIEGVIAQNYPNFEHIIVDGASTDETLEILKEYPHLKWISEPDEGEAEALNKALRMATGDIINWLNVDDVYFDNSVLHTVAEEWQKNPEVGVVYGKGLVVNEAGEVVMYRTPLIPVTLSALMRWWTNLNLFQPAIFYSATLIKEIGFFREDLFFSIDYEYWMRVAAKGYRHHFVDRIFANATLVREGAKSGNSVEEQHKNWQEMAASFQDHLSRPERINFWRDFYLYRIRNPLGYSEPVSVPEREEALLGMTLALLELNDVHNAAATLQELTTKHKPSPDVYWIIAEVQHRVGQGADSCRSAEMGKAVQLQALTGSG
jgi:glycosyltransferase involved in cell wall biosynthesis